MCGICGIINFNNSSVDEFSIRAMMKKMKHRGPDDEGVFIERNIGLGFVRLSIIDLSIAGHQPMFDETGQYLIIHNGEVYNYIEIREELKKKGYNFKSNTDTEVVLNSYIEWGEDCLNKFNGMWAFAIYDKIKREVFATRDRFGVKPFYYFQDDNKFIFASEIPALLEIESKLRKQNETAIYNYLVFNRTDYDETTFFNEVIKLKHGHYIKIKKNQIFIRRWYNLKKNLNYNNVSNPEYKNLLSDSVELRLRSDVPVGVSFSGGLDSSSILSLLLNSDKKSCIKTFSAVYGSGVTGDESNFINEYAKYNKLKMNFITPDENLLLHNLDNFISAQSEPVPSTSQMTQYFVMKLASENVVVILDGQGADEQLAGYHYFFGYYLKELLKNIHLAQFSVELYYLLKIHGFQEGFLSFIYFLLPNRLQRIAKNRSQSFLSREYVKKHLSEHFVYDNLYNVDSLKKGLINHFEYKLEHLLKWGDRNSMWFSLESRNPFLDYRLVEHTLSLPNRKIINKGTTKYILRESLKDILPTDIYSRTSKIGFETPENVWFSKDKLYNFSKNIFTSISFTERGYFNSKILIDILEKNKKNEVSVFKTLWKAINLELWFRKYID